MARRIGAVISLAALVVLMWMNRFQYERTGSTQVLVRINRFTGRSCFLTSNRGWDSQLLRAQEPGKDKNILDAFKTEATPTADRNMSNLDSLMYGSQPNQANECQ